MHICSFVSYNCRIRKDYSSGLIHGLLLPMASDRTKRLTLLFMLRLKLRYDIKFHKLCIVENYVTSMHKV